MNQYVDLNRIEFVITDACSGRCRHCSNGGRTENSGSVNANASAAAIKQLAESFTIESVMTFGGEPLLYADTVCKIHSAARDCGIPMRQIITNGFFSKDEERIDKVAKSLCDSGVNDILLSVDVFHQEFIPLEPVLQFAEALVRYKTPSLCVHPAWVVSEQHENSYNSETKRLLKLFSDRGIAASEGNNIFPSGNALKHLGEYFAPPDKIDFSALCGSVPYTTRLDEIKSFGINPNGDVNLCSITIGNIYKDNIMDIVDRYDPYSSPATHAVLTGGVSWLMRYAEAQGLTFDTSDCRSACGVCRKIMEAAGEKSKG
jgi:MoaA/NifB/PqqE/SkfB family radical SAM enzyme